MDAREGIPPNAQRSAVLGVVLVCMCEPSPYATKVRSARIHDISEARFSENSQLARSSNIHPSIRFHCRRCRLPILDNELICTCVFTNIHVWKKREYFFLDDTDERYTTFRVTNLWKICETTCSPSRVQSKLLPTRSLRAWFFSGSIIWRCCLGLVGSFVLSTCWWHRLLLPNTP